jgi:hypothetical protein
MASSYSFTNTPRVETLTLEALEAGWDEDVDVRDKRLVHAVVSYGRMLGEFRQPRTGAAAAQDTFLATELTQRPDYFIIANREAYFYTILFHYANNVWFDYQRTGVFFNLSPTHVANVNWGKDPESGAPALSVRVEMAASPSLPDIRIMRLRLEETVISRQAMVEGLTARKIKDGVHISSLGSPRSAKRARQTPGAPPPAPLVPYGTPSTPYSPAATPNAMSY